MSTLASRFREVAERFKAHAWKACWVQALEGSNPFLSAKESHESGISHLKDNSFDLIGSNISVAYYLISIPRQINSICGLLNSKSTFLSKNT